MEIVKDMRKLKEPSFRCVVLNYVIDVSMKPFSNKAFYINNIGLESSYLKSQLYANHMLILELIA